MFQDINHPMKDVAIFCDYQRCKSMDKTAVAICFSPDCASFNGTDHKPTRYCSQCNKINHQSRRTMDHITHGILPSPWDMEQVSGGGWVRFVTQPANKDGGCKNGSMEQIRGGWLLFFLGGGGLQDPTNKDGGCKNGCTEQVRGLGSSLIVFVWA